MDEEYTSREKLERLFALTLRSSAWEELLNRGDPWENISQGALYRIWQEIDVQVATTMRVLRDVHNDVDDNEDIKRARLREAPCLMMALMGINTPNHVTENSSELETWWLRNGRTDCSNLGTKTLCILDIAVAARNYFDMKGAIISVLGVFLTSDTFRIQRDAVLQIANMLGIDCPHLRN